MEPALHNTPFLFVCEFEFTNSSHKFKDCGCYHTRLSSPSIAAQIQTPRVCT
ncbi:hypothetical protein Scep_024817 [Stephania cephalantha]|uniref:Uncharacterized protein n=1 Tax=Stephania cephalantha TaxID=152367 RepID=A0AAP0F2S4_9MAGN